LSKTGDRIYRAGKIYEAQTDHQAGKLFNEDKDSHWKELAPNTSLNAEVKLWTNKEHGKKLYSLRPRIQLNPTFGNVSEPDTKHYIDRDIYTHIRYGEIEEEDEALDAQGFRPAKEHKITFGDTIRSGGKFIILDSLHKVSNLDRYGLNENDIAVKASMRVIASLDTTYKAEPIWVLKESSYLDPIEFELEPLRLKLKFTEIDPQESLMTFTVAEHKDNVRDFVVMQAIVFPWINILWIGIVVMALGTLLAVIERFRLNRISGTQA
jgi:cytochrome c-type biogenesis protein CcmF